MNLKGSCPSMGCKSVVVILIASSLTDSSSCLCPWPGKRSFDVVERTECRLFPPPPVHYTCSCILLAVPGAKRALVVTSQELSMWSWNSRNVQHHDGKKICFVFISIRNILHRQPCKRILKQHNLIISFSVWMQARGRDMKHYISYIIMNSNLSGFKRKAIHCVRVIFKCWQKYDQIKCSINKLIHS